MISLRLKKAPKVKSRKTQSVSKAFAKEKECLPDGFFFHEQVEVWLVQERASCPRAVVPDEEKKEGGKFVTFATFHSRWFAVGQVANFCERCLLFNYADSTSEAKMG